MSPSTLKVKRAAMILKPDPSRVLLRSFDPGNAKRAQRIVAQIMSISESDAGSQLEAVSAKFAKRHRDIHRLFEERFEQVRGLAPVDQKLSRQRQLLIGSYFLSEYSLESTALCNPSMVVHPDQRGLPDGALRFVLSLRATGEGSISSITFRTGMIHPNRRIEVMAPTGYVFEPRQIPHALYEKKLFEWKLLELGLTNEFTSHATGRLEESFTIGELQSVIEEELGARPASEGEKDCQNAARGMLMLAKSNYALQFQPEEDLSERVVFPVSPSQRKGIEDARFVCFREEDGRQVYFATFTAFDGRLGIPQLLETSDFLLFRLVTLNGPAIKNKGMALFPRKIHGLYAMLGRQDQENIYLMFSDNIHFWYRPKILLKPAFPWEFVQIGNCGPPIETKAGWLVLSHGVGPVREYSIGAFLLDLDDPSKVLGRLSEPLLRTEPGEREGNVPNVVYSCGALLHDGQLFIPFGVSDYATRFATVPLNDVLAAMR